MSAVIGAAADFVAKRFGGSFSVRETVVAVAAARVSLAPNDPDRVVLIIMNLGTQVLTIGTERLLAAGSGLLLNTSGSILSTNVEEDAILPAWEWLGISTVTGTNAYVVEVIREV